VRIRPLAAADVDAVAEVDFAAFQDVALRHGLAPVVRAVRDSRTTVRNLLAADPLGGFVAEDEDRIVGHAWVHPRGPIATVGPLAVEPACQRRGVGRALLAHCLQAVGPRTTQVRLVHESFNVATLHLYLTAGFRIVAPLLELVREPEAEVVAPPVPATVTVRKAVPGDQARIVARDARTFGAQRPQDVERYLRSAHGVVAERGKTLAGFALGGFGTLGSAAAEDPALVLALLGALAADPGLRAERLRIMVLATDRMLVDGLRAAGFALFRACHYMIRGGGTAPPAGYVLMGGDYM
jgi:ribosomal protein S18 acetylase RimI-like enzyme